MPLTKLMEVFKDIGSFYLVGASYIVNFIYVQSILQTTLEMTNGDKIPVPRRLRGELQKQYFDFYTKEATQK
jgi:two-component system LytT family response regulator